MARGVFSTVNHLLYTGALATAVPLTIAAWIYPANVTNINTIGGLFYTGGAAALIDGWRLRVMNTTGYPAADAADGTGTTTATHTTGVTLSAWNHIAAVFVSATSRYVYLAGVASAQSIGARTPSAAPDKSTIGCTYRQDNVKNTAADASYIAEVAFWNVALTTEELLQLAKGYSPLFVQRASLLDYYPFVRGDASGDEPDVRRGLKMVEQGTVAVQSHPRVFYPAPRSIVTRAPAVGGGTTSKHAFANTFQGAFG